MEREQQQQQQPNWNPSISRVSIQSPPDCFLNPNFETDPFESALSSLVSSPAASNAGAGNAFMIRELIGKLGTISNSGEISPQSCVIGSRNTSCYNTPLNSPPRLNLSSVFGAGNHPNQLPSNLGLSPLNADPGFVERAAKFSCFGFGSELGYGSLPKSEPVSVSRVGGLEDVKDGDLGDSREGSSVSEQNPAGEFAVKGSQSNTNSRKRKATSKAKGIVKEEKVVAEKDELSNVKRSKSEEDGKKEKVSVDGEESGNGKDGKKESAKVAEPLKDYIHVRARRGQATDSHSLAERVRREKISERMKFLQDLVPGCNMVTGKAVVLDEIINYVQSLQRQVEFLSMKLSTVNPRMEFNMEALLSKDILQLPPTMLPSDSSAPVFPYGFQSQQFPTMPNDLHHGTSGPFLLNPLDAAMRQNGGIQVPSTDGFGDSATQIPAYWEDDLHSLVQMGFPLNEMQVLQGANPTTQMKVEL